MESRFEPVMILSPHAIPFQVAPSFEIDHDPLHGSIGDQHLRRNVANADPGPEKDAVEDVSVIAQKRPVRVLQLPCQVGHFP